MAALLCSAKASRDEPPPVYEGPPDRKLLRPLLALVQFRPSTPRMFILQSSQDCKSLLSATVVVWEPFGAMETKSRCMSLHENGSARCAETGTAVASLHTKAGGCVGVRRPAVGSASVAAAHSARSCLAVVHVEPKQ